MNKNININCELPLCLYNRNIELNDMDFVLFHLMSNPTYKDYYKLVRETMPHRTMILDNSAYEFFIKGEQLDLEEYIKCIIDLKPDYYILPDVLMNKALTIKNATDFLQYCKKMDLELPGKPLAVIQGNSEKDMVECLMHYLDNGLTNIAIPFHNSFYKDIIYGCDVRNYVKKLLISIYGKYTPDMEYTIGRIILITRLHLMLKNCEYIHILGSHCPAELGLYDKILDNIKSMDTGYPVKCGLVGVEMGTENEKPECIIDDFFESQLSDDIKNKIIVNIKKFKEYKESKIII